MRWYHWIGIFYQSVKYGWEDSFWGCKASWWWSIERVIPHPFEKIRSPANRKMMYALLSPYWHKKGYHFCHGFLWGTAEEVKNVRCYFCDKSFDHIDKEVVFSGQDQTICGMRGKWIKQKYE